MATPTEITVSYNRKVQLDQFEPISHFAEITVALEEGDVADEVYNDYSETVEDMVERSLAQRITQKKLESDDE